MGQLSGMPIVGEVDRVDVTSPAGDRPVSLSLQRSGGAVYRALAACDTQAMDLTGLGRELRWG